MREILFRGKRKDNGEWVVGTIQEFPDGVFRVCVPSQWDDQLNGFLVDPSTIGQYTGLTDKNSVKIFEGDIVRITLNTPWKPITAVSSVYFKSGCFLVDWGSQSATFDSFVGSTVIEVIGDIHDNPELLEEEVFYPNGVNFGWITVYNTDEENIFGRDPARFPSLKPGEAVLISDIIGDGENG